MQTLTVWSWFQLSFIRFIVNVFCFSVSSGGGHFFNRNSMSPRSVVCEMELPDIQASLDLYDDNKSWGLSSWFQTPPSLSHLHLLMEGWSVSFLGGRGSLITTKWMDFWAFIPTDFLQTKHGLWNRDPGLDLSLSLDLLAQRFRVFIFLRRRQTGELVVGSNH